MNKLLLSLVMVVGLVGCTMTPRYERPQSTVADSWPQPGLATGSSSNELVTADIGWRDFFRDAQLQRLLEVALTNNSNLRLAMLNVAAYQARYRIQRNELIPVVNLNAGGSRQRVVNGLAGTTGPVTYSQYYANLGMASYEVDLFGRVRSLKGEALERYFAAEETQRSAQIALIAEVSGAYLTRRELMEQLAVAQQTLAAVQRAYDLTKASYDVGTVSELDFRMAEAQVETARANVAGFEQQLAQQENYLVFLLSQPLPADLPPAAPFEEQLGFPNVPAGLPSDLLQRRPDILAAEHELKAANAVIGAARAAFFPTITLTGSAGFSSTDLENLFVPGSRVWSFAPQLQWPIFAIGTMRAGLDATKVGKLIEVQNYQQAIQTAFREVADALAAQKTIQTQLAANQALVQAEQRRFELADACFRHGVDSYLNVLTAQQALYSAQQNLIRARYAHWFNLINLYQALGGGWQEYTHTAAAE